MISIHGKTAGLILLVWLIPSVTMAHPDHESKPIVRSWTFPAWGTVLEASFVTQKADQVCLCNQVDQMVWVELGQLSPVDQQWVRDRQAKIIQVNLGRMKPTPMSAMEFQVTAPLSSFPILLMVLGLSGWVVFIRTLGTRRISVSLGSVVVLMGFVTVLVSAPADKTPLPIQKAFEPFKDSIRYHSDEDFFYVESSGFPDHPMMIGITAWQQQVPLPQSYQGRNAWQIPLHPRMAARPVSAKTALFRGAIALAVNGVPIFNPIKNDGRTDTFLAGELDEYGGHCGRGDDYHYHIGPVHLEKIVGKGKPIGYALDGFPLYGYTDAAGKIPDDLDRFNGRMENDGYRYYSSKKYPYVNGGLRGEVTVRGDQIDPQPRANPVRPDGRPLRGAKITDFIRDDKTKTYTLQYELMGKTYKVQYTAGPEGTIDFTWIDPQGRKTSASYHRRPLP